MTLSKNSLVFTIFILLSACAHEKVKINYSSNYFYSEGNKLVVVCDFIPKLIPFPHQDHLDNISQYYNSSSDGKFKNYGMMDSIYHFDNEHVTLDISEPIDVGFKKRYNFMMKAKVEGNNFELLSGLQLGGNVNQLLDQIPKESFDENSSDTPPNLSSYKEIEFVDHWQIYKHRYILEKGRVVQFMVDFE